MKEDSLSQSPELLYRKRSQQFTRDIRPYVFYAMQSGTIGASFLFLIGMYLYNELLSSAPEGFPFVLLASLLMAPALAFGSFRTFLQEADQIYLLPLENKFASYLQLAFRRAVYKQFTAAALMWTVLQPMLRAGTPDGGRGIIVFLQGLVMVLLIKWTLLLLRRKQLEQAEPGTRRMLALLRWLLAWTTAYALMALPLGTGALTAAAGCLITLLLLLIFLPSRSSVPWLAFIAEEKRQKAAIFRFLNLFIDVPYVQSKPRSIPAPPRLAERVGFHRERAYDYLYLLIWLRSESFGITLRLAVIGFLLVMAAGPGIPAGLLYAVFALLTALQLKELQRAYQTIDWTHIYPLPAGQRGLSALRIRRRLHAACLAAIAVPLWLHSVTALVSEGSRTMLAAMLLWPIGCLAVSWLYHRKQKEG